MKKLLVVCGTGVATSTVVLDKLAHWLVDKGMQDQLELDQSNISDAIGRMDDYDVIVTTTIVPEELETKVVDAVPLLTGIGADEVYSAILKKIH